MNNKFIYTSIFLKEGFSDSINKWIDRHDTTSSVLVGTGVALTYCVLGLLATFSLSRRLSQQAIYNKKYSNILKKIIPGRNWRVYIIDLGKDQLNAFVFADDNIFVTKALFRYLNEREIISILLHESAHIEGRHSIYNILARSSLIGFLFGSIVKIKLATPTKSDRTNPITSTLAVLIIILIFALKPTLAYLSRRFERTSDSFAIKMGYGKELASALSKLVKIDKIKPCETKMCKVIRKIEEIFDDHPDIFNRIKDALDKALVASENIEQLSLKFLSFVGIDKKNIE
jgi:Zn-dependent protease with chaperone function